MSLINLEALKHRISFIWNGLLPHWYCYEILILHEASRWMLFLCLNRLHSHVITKLPSTGLTYVHILAFHYYEIVIEFQINIAMRPGIDLFVSESFKHGTTNVHLPVLK